MKFIKELLFTLLACGFSGTALAQYIQVDDTYSAQQLVEDVLIDSPCANVSNFTVTGDNFSSGQQSYGFFDATGSSFPFTNGIVLSTSRAKRTEGPNFDLIDEGSNSWAGDSDLDRALGISGSVNATILEFDFTPLTSQISFDYIFASEEYHDNAPCRYSDGFAFLLKEAGSSNVYQNLALVPNTTTPVKVTSVHPQIDGNTGCPAINEQYFDAFNETEYPTNFNGQTVVMTAKATVIPGTTYHIKLVIADEGNVRYDSAIFLGGGSFKVGSDLGPNRLEATQNPLCAGQTYTLDARETGSNTYKWFKNNIEIPGETTPQYIVQDAGVYNVEVTLNGTTCVAKGEVTIEYAALPVLTSPVSLVQCDADNDGITTYNLTTINTIITGNTSDVVYYKTLGNAQDEVNPITNPLTYQNTSTNQLIAKVKNAYGCANYATVNLQIANNTIANQAPVSKCDTDGPQDGFTAFDLTEVSPQVVSGLPPGLIVNYYLSANDAVLQINPLPNTFTNTTTNQQIIYARIINGADCYGIKPITLIVNTFLPNDFEDKEVYLCDGNSTTLSVASGFSNYEWSTGVSGPNAVSIAVASSGIYTVIVKNSNGCFATKKFIVKDSGIAIFTSLPTVNDFAGSQNSVLVNYSGSGDYYEFSLDGIRFQDSPLFTDVPTGEYWVYIRDTHGCGTTPPVFITVLDYPRYFTPNGDSYNEIWAIPFLKSNSIITIFDRYGKIIYSFNGTTGWNGKLNSQDLPSTDYWFVVSLENGRIVKGHFSLKR
ncbi:T9SS type B sorting domain-containing protein [Flavobacterium sp. GT3R68]|uniref:T9SS type B sorting domain-containing protein n=1 Tax=Flavobacterium sp. GT3R68 TaxID=2594437 RepID=UPI000F88CE61|nr:choice-of-anchor L domain-containing protein [Flavobacterium sp. GT3R68]RTY92417.1 T9SS type B sorting domain-containing protein [Flavobacterium sp. GSN2]TRW92333.1 T9SS type B sorting domain-containing protein [Flavobacterium sp. GT3R68]